MSTSSAASRIQAKLEELFQGNIASGNAHIKFQLTPEISAFLSMEQVQESAIVEATQITPLPGMPEFVIGMMNSRDRVFCIFDLAQLLTLPSPIIASRQYQIIVLQTTDEPSVQIGLAVMSLQGITRLAREQIQSVRETIGQRSEITPSSYGGVISDSKLVPYVSGTVQQGDLNFPILKFEQILEALNRI